MSKLAVDPYGWHPYWTDHRDYSSRHDAVVSLLGMLKMRKRKSQNLPDSVDWREYCGPVEDQQGLPTSSAHACVALIQQLERRSSGRLLRLSRLFVHYAARRQLNITGKSGVSLRATLKAIVRCGVPPEEFWPYDMAHLDHEPDAFSFSFHREYRPLRYMRLDSGDLDGEQILHGLRSFLAAGFPFVFGFPVCNSIGIEAEIPFPTAADRILGGQAVTAVGYDDKRRIRSDKGALLVRNSWGSDWGDEGYGWLPFAYVKERLAADFWTLLKPSWLRSGEFDMPQ
jgi:C1A family cysteine protease